MVDLIVAGRNLTLGGTERRHSGSSNLGLAAVAILMDFKKVSAPTQQRSISPLRTGCLVLMGKAETERFELLLTAYDIRDTSTRSW